MEWTDKGNRIAVIALHKCGIERARIFELPESLNIFVYRTVNLFLDTGRISNRKRSGRPRMVRTPQVIAAVRSRINRNLVRKKKNHDSGNGYCAENHEWHYQTRLGTWGF